MCTVLLPSGGYPIAVNKYIISYGYVNWSLLSRCKQVKFQDGKPKTCKWILSYNFSTWNDLLFVRHVISKTVLGEKRLATSSCPSVRMEQLGSHWTNFRGNWHLSIFRKSFEKINVSLKSNKNNGYFTYGPMHIFYKISISFSKKKNISLKICRENQNTFCFHKYIYIYIYIFFRKSCCLWDNVEEYCRAG